MATLRLAGAPVLATMFAAAISFGAPAAAQTNTGLEATVGSICTIGLTGTPSSNAGFTLSAATSGFAGTVVIPQTSFVNSSAVYVGNQTVSGNARRIDIPMSVDCNRGGWAFQVTSVGGGLKRTTPNNSNIIGGAFATRVDYSAGVTVTDSSYGLLENSTLTTTTGAANAASTLVTVNDGAFATGSTRGNADGTARLRINLLGTNAGPTAPLLAGTWTDTVRVTFTPGT